MKLALLVLTFLFTAAAQAHCPIPFVENSGDYCMDLEWQTGDKKIKGVWNSVDILTPHMNKETDIPQKWIYSRVLIRIWKNGDKTHVPVVLENLRIFPFMTMLDGMHHQATYNFSYKEDVGAYELSGFSLQEMEGCWSFRATTTSPTDEVDSSQLLASVIEYKNLSPEENKTFTGYCEALASGTPVVSNGGHHHH